MQKFFFSCVEVKRGFASNGIIDRVSTITQRNLHKEEHKRENKEPTKKQKKERKNCNERLL